MKLLMPAGYMLTLIGLALALADPALSPWFLAMTMLGLGLIVVALCYWKRS